MGSKRSSAREDDFDAILISELDVLVRGEQRLELLFPKLPSQPELRDYFLLKLTEVRQRADRLNAVLNPLSGLEPPPAHASPSIQPAA
jgi:hypothetical protein